MYAKGVSRASLEKEAESPTVRQKVDGELAQCMMWDRGRVARIS